MYTTPPVWRQFASSFFFSFTPPDLTPTNRNPRHDNPQRNRPPFIKPDAHQRQAGNIQQPGPQPHADPLAEKHLPVRGAQAEHHDAEDDEEVTRNEHDAEVAQVEERARQHAEENQQPGLHGADPGDGAWSRRREKVGFVVRLECAVAEREAPDVDLDVDVSEEGCGVEEMAEGQTYIRKPPKTLSQACKPPSGGGGITDSVVLVERASKVF